MIQHASCVAYKGAGLLILGPSGAGKSALALQLMALGAQLVADDQTQLCVEGQTLIATAPPMLSGLIEARGLGILRAPALKSVPIRLVADLSHPETERLPPSRKVTILGIACDLVLAAQSSHFPAALMCYLEYGRHA